MGIYKTLLIKDLRHAWQDPVLMAALLGPLVLLLLSRYGFLPAAHWMEENYAFQLEQYRGFAALFLVITIPMLTGMLTGLLMLDERDENMIAYYAVTPLMRKGYLLYRMLLPVVLCVALSALYMSFSALQTIDWDALTLSTLLLLALESPLLALFLATFSANKVEGLALSKLGGLLVAGPVVAYFVPGYWQVLGAWLPSYWPAKVLQLTQENAPSLAFVFLLSGLLLHVIYLYFMFSVFKNKAS